jgi:hypothetical protein
MNINYENYIEDNELEDLKREFAPCKLCKGTRVIYESHGMLGGQKEAVDCECVDE